MNSPYDASKHRKSEPVRNSKMQTNCWGCGCYRDDCVVMIGDTPICEWCESRFKRVHIRQARGCYARELAKKWKVFERDYVKPRLVLQRDEPWNFKPWNPPELIDLAPEPVYNPL